MSRFSRLIPAVAVTILLAACGQAGDSPVGPSGPSLDGGPLVTGGNRSDSTATTTNNVPPPDSTNRGGPLVTGGN
jgi:hypothetical protein